MTLLEFYHDARIAECIAAIVVVLVGVWMFWLRPLLERKRPHESIPMIPNSHWLLGHLYWLLRKGYLEKQTDLVDHADDQGRCSIWMGLVPSISLSTKADAKRLLWNIHTRHTIPMLKYHLERLAGPKNLFWMNGKEWKYYNSALRRAMSRLDPVFVQSITQETTRKLTNNLRTKIAKQGDCIEIASIMELMKMMTMDVFGHSAFSHDFGCCANLELCAFAKAFGFMEADIMRRCTEYTLLPQNLFYWIPTTRNSKFHQQRSLARSELRDILQTRNDHQNAKDIVSNILEAHAKVASTSTLVYDALTEEDLVDFLFSLLLAGYETLSAALTYTLFLLSRNPEWEEQCFKEVQNMDATSNKEVELPICRGAVMEALRLYPVATGTSRNLEKPLAFQDGVSISKGCHIGVSFWLIHRSEKHFPNPLEFRPDRWVPKADEKTFSTTTAAAAACFHAPNSIPAGDMDAFFAFSGGARSCPGQNYALREATVALAWLLKDLKFTIDPSYELEIEWKAVVQGPKGGIPAKVSIRESII